MAASPTFFTMTTTTPVSTYTTSSSGTELARWQSELEDARRRRDAIPIDVSTTGVETQTNKENRRRQNELTMLISQLTQKITAVGGRVPSYATSLFTGTSYTSSVLSTTVTTSAQIDALNRQIRELDKDLLTKDAEKLALNRRIAQLDQAVLDQERENLTLTVRITTLNQEIENLKRGTGGAPTLTPSAEMTALKSERDDLQRRNIELQREMLQKNTRTQQLDREKNDLLAQVSGLQREIQKLQQGTGSQISSMEFAALQHQRDNYAIRVNELIAEQELRELAARAASESFAALQQEVAAVRAMATDRLERDRLDLAEKAQRERAAESAAQEAQARERAAAAAALAATERAAEEKRQADQRQREADRLQREAGAAHRQAQEALRLEQLQKDAASRERLRTTGLQEAEAQAAAAEATRIAEAAARSASSASSAASNATDTANRAADKANDANSDVRGIKNEVEQARKEQEESRRAVNETNQLQGLTTKNGDIGSFFGNLFSRGGTSASSGSTTPSATDILEAARLALITSPPKEAGEIGGRPVIVSTTPYTEAEIAAQRAALGEEQPGGPPVLSVPIQVGQPLSVQLLSNPALATTAKYPWLDGNMKTIATLPRQFFYDSVKADAKPIYSKEVHGVWYDPATFAVNFYTTGPAMATLVRAILSPVFDSWYATTNAAMDEDRAAWNGTIVPLLFLIVRRIDLERAANEGGMLDLQVESAWRFMRDVTDWLFVRGMTKTEMPDDQRDVFRQQRDETVNNRIIGNRVFVDINWPTLVSGFAGKIQPSDATRNANTLRGFAVRGGYPATPPIINSYQKGALVVGTPKNQLLLLCALQLSTRRIKDVVAANPNILNDAEVMRVTDINAATRAIPFGLDNVVQSIKFPNLLGKQPGGQISDVNYPLAGTTAERTFLVSVFQLFYPNKPLVQSVPANVLAPRNSWLANIFPSVIVANGLSIVLPKDYNDPTKTFVDIARSLKPQIEDLAVQKSLERDYGLDAAGSNVSLPMLANEFLAFENMLSDTTTPSTLTRRVVASMVAYTFFYPFKLYDTEKEPKRMIERFGRRPQYALPVNASTAVIEKFTVVSTAARGKQQPSSTSSALVATTTEQTSLFDRARLMSTVIRIDPRHAQYTDWLDAADVPINTETETERNTFKVIESNLKQEVTAFVPVNLLWYYIRDEYDKRATQFGSIGRIASFFVLRGRVDVGKLTLNMPIRFSSVNGDAVHITKLSESGDVIKIEASSSLKILPYSLPKFFGAPQLASDQTRNGRYYVIAPLTEVGVMPPLPNAPAATGTTKSKAKAMAKTTASSSSASTVMSRTKHDTAMTIEKLLQDTQLADLLFSAASGSYTLFAPSPAALVASAGTLHALQQEGRGDLLRFHVVRGDYNKEQVLDLFARNAALPTALAGSVLEFARGEREAPLDGRIFASDLEETDLTLKNKRGLRQTVRMHVINRLLIPAGGADVRNRNAMTNRYRADNNHAGNHRSSPATRFYQLLKEAQLTRQVFASPNIEVVTILVPTSEAFAAIADVYENLALDQKQATLKYHVLPGNFSADTLRNMFVTHASAMTLAGKSLTFHDNVHAGVTKGVLYRNEIDLENKDEIYDVDTGMTATVYYINRVLIADYGLIGMAQTATEAEAELAAEEAAAAATTFISGAKKTTTTTSSSSSSAAAAPLSSSTVVSTSSASKFSLSAPSVDSLAALNTHHENVVRALGNVRNSDDAVAQVMALATIISKARVTAALDEKQHTELVRKTRDALVLNTHLKPQEKRAAHAEISRIQSEK